MDRQAFRNRMQQLKQYREQNPGKTYLDFKKYAEGGEIPPSNKPIIPEEPQPYKGKLYKDRYGRKYTEDQMNEYYDSNTAVNNNMLQQLEGSLKEADPTSIDSRRRYLRSGTEQKAYMNTLRRRMLNDGTIKNIDDQVSTKLLNNYINQLSDSDYIKKAYKEHKNISSYTKWFNSIPLLGVGALGVYGYENTNE